MRKRYFTVVYEYISPARTAELMAAPDAVAGGHKHALRELDYWREQAEYAELPYNLSEIAKRNL